MLRARSVLLAWNSPLSKRFVVAKAKCNFWAKSDLTTVDFLEIVSPQAVFDGGLSIVKFGPLFSPF